jgi:prepilin-type processing-associated H-X9-DG protein
MNHTGANSAAGAGTPYWSNDRTRGVMGANIAVTMAEIRDGSSNTAMLGEIRAGVDAVDTRGVWAMGDSSSCLWGHGSGLFNEVAGTNSPGIGGDNMRFCDKLITIFGGSSWKDCPGLAAEGMTCYTDWGSINNQQGVKSMHEGGAHLCFADGSIHFIGDFIDITGNPSVWDRLMASADGFPVGGSEY